MILFSSSAVNEDWDHCTCLILRPSAIGGANMERGRKWVKAVEWIGIRIQPEERLRRRVEPVEWLGVRVEPPRTQAGLVIR